MPSRIEDYALIGDCETAGLISREGSVDWLCFPRFDSGACFAALLGNESHGHWLIAPAEPVRSVSRRYRNGTLILETEFQTDNGSVTLIDWMPPRSITEVPDVLRIVAGTRGKVKMRMQLVIRFDYGSVVPWVQKIEDGIRATAGPDSIHFRAGVEFHGEDFKTAAEFTVSEGDRIPFELAWFPTYGSVPESVNAEESLQKSESWWRTWSEGCTYEGRWKEAVVRSLITLKALTFQPTGGIVAAATTSLPEKIGGVRNWDYRYCWIRDATFTLYALVHGGYTQEAKAWREWLVNSVAGVPSKMQIMYGPAGERRLTEITLEWLPGYENSSPVRIGNAAHGQFQLDVYGELMDALYVSERAGLAPNADAWHLQLVLMEYLEEAWKKPDQGIWETRGPLQHFTASKALAWVAVDRAIRSVEELQHKGPVEKWKRLRNEIHAQVCSQGYDYGLNSFVQSYGSKQVDASLLLIPLVGFLPPSDPRVQGSGFRVQGSGFRVAVGEEASEKPNHEPENETPNGEPPLFLDVVDCAEAAHLVIFSSGWGDNFDAVPHHFPDQAPPYRGRDGDKPFAEIGFFRGDKPVGDFLVRFVFIENDHGTVGRPVIWYFIEIHKGQGGKTLLKLSFPPFQVRLPLLCSLVFRIFTEIPVLASPQNLFRQIHPQFPL
jgi:GH15 family glucan-1,4-alpha-glucosidase